MGHVLVVLAIAALATAVISFAVSAWYFFLFFDNRKPSSFWQVNFLVPFSLFIDKFWTEEALIYRRKMLRYLCLAASFGAVFVGIIYIHGPMLPIP